MERAQIECSSYDKILKRYDRPETLFYLDPPYWGIELYRYNFGPEDFKVLEEHLRNLRGKFILSLNDVPEVRSLFKRFYFRDVQLHYTSQKSSGKRYKEVFITNFKH